ncbi:MAG: DbpA RNA binding domain-containing protein [Deltaproteobacteria bacterium]|nr:DbpA RNA binding domain-containing protein [Deltaproteobacteria bacterium]
MGAPRVAPEEEAGLRAAAEEREVGTDAGRKTRRSRSRSGADDRDAIVTSEGDVEYYETLDGPTREGQGSARGETEPPEVEDANVVRLFLNLGRRQGVRADELSRFIVSDGQLEAAEIVRVDVRDRYTFVNVVPDAADRVLERVSGKTLNDRTLRVERAKS